MEFYRKTGSLSMSEQEQNLNGIGLQAIALFLNEEDGKALL